MSIHDSDAINWSETEIIEINMVNPGMKHNRALKILNDAAAGGYGIPSMCCYNVEGIIATIRAAEAKRSPAMILLFPWAVQYADSLLVHLAAEACSKAKVPVTLHMDHAQDPEMIKRAADMGGFDSIMVDMSHYDKEENLRLTHELTEYCHARGIATEAEPGRIEGGEDGVSDTADLEGVLTTPEEAREFVDTGIDWLAPAFGNVHGSYGPRGIQLEYERLDGINKEVGKEVRLALHGADPFTMEIFQRCIGHGISKININKVMNNEVMNVWKEKAGTAPLTSVIEEGTNNMQKAVERCMDMLGSTGKA
ncbi:putative fructose-bisphosphate aldolase [Pseudovirgaria hyperparasitica]|uniref:Fructose-bisphosphate aldolase n=1 Tax=Pseudovirgaria hyperparasitica TaxID=470096 RepID=A0A6A6W627_9PEZI|nr:putative fructose-bisphosphate aldolase [Pseudovirgaria hyperparasitica]KAF2758378.1 putative fructose-bisphosphate aldolase [Pseudovirgaria hyperparasitica]